MHQGGAPGFGDAVNERAVRVSKAAVLNTMGARAEAEEAQAVLPDLLAADEEPAAALVARGGGAATGTAPSSQDTVELGMWVILTWMNSVRRGCDDGHGRALMGPPPLPTVQRDAARAGAARTAPTTPARRTVAVSILRNIEVDL